MDKRRINVRIQRAFTGLTAGLTALSVVIALNIASGHMSRQDDKASWRELANDYMRQSDSTGNVFERVDFDRLGQGASTTSRLLRDLTSFDAKNFDTARATMRERQCLAEAVYYEARSETVSGQMAVAEVVMNRVRSRHYSNSICDVVYQGSHRKSGCQFSFTCDGSIAKAPYGRGWTRARSVADHVIMGFARPVTSSATHYHTIDVDPIWNDTLVQTRQIGAHIFYRIPNRSERRLLNQSEV